MKAQATAVSAAAPVAAEGWNRLTRAVLKPGAALENGARFAHYELAAGALAKADPMWLARVVNRRVPLTDWRDALARRPDDVKPVIQLTCEDTRWRSGSRTTP